MTKTRTAKKIVQCVDTYSKLHKDIFPEVRTYEVFKYIMVGILNDLKRKSLPAIAWVHLSFATSIYTQEN